MSGRENTIVGRVALLVDDDLTSEAQTSTGGTLVNGPQIDLQSVSERRYRRVRVQIPYRIVNSTTAGQVSLSAAQQDTTATGGTYAAFGTSPTAATVTATGTTNAVWEFEQDLTDVNRYYRVNFTPEIQTSTGGVTTATGITFGYAGVATLMEANRYPASG